MANTTTGTGADTMEDIRDEPALESVGVDPDAPIAQAVADEPGQNDEDDDEFDEDDEESDEDDDEAEDEETKQASDDEDKK